MTSPKPAHDAVLYLGAEPARVDGLLSGSHPHSVAQDLRPDSEHVCGGTGGGIDVPGPALASEKGNSGAQLPVVVEVDMVFLGDVDHAVVGGDVQG